LTVVPTTRSPAAWLAALVGLALTLALFYPGFMSVDSAVQWAQARIGAYENHHPVLMALTWSAIDRVWPGPGGLFVLHSTLFWLAAGWLAYEAFQRTLPQVVLALALGLWPPVLGVIAHVWKDGPMTAFVLLAVAALLAEHRRPSRWLLVLAVAMLAIACAYRHNALPLVIPFAWYIGDRIGLCRLWRIAATGLVTVLIATLAVLPDRLPGVTQRTMWPMLALCDLAAVSIAVDEMLIPPSAHDPRLTVDELRGLYLPHAHIAIFDNEGGKIPIPSMTELSDVQRRDIARAWRRLIVDYPQAYLAHRWQTSALLFGVYPSRVPDGMTLWLGMSSLGDNPPVERLSPLRDGSAAWLRTLIDTPLFSAWLYVAALLALAASAFRRTVHPLFWPVVSSALLYALPLTMIAVSAEFRYLLWTVVAVPVCMALRLRGSDPANNASEPVAAACNDGLQG
jgi:hypothetical protein